MEKNINETVYVSLEPTNVHHPVVQGFIDGNGDKILGLTANVRLQNPLPVVDLGSVIKIPQKK